MQQEQDTRTPRPPRYDARLSTEIRMPRDLKDALVAHAYAQQRPISSEVRLAVQAWLVSHGVQVGDGDGNGSGTASTAAPAQNSEPSTWMQAARAARR
jgi:hypothetical protein